MSSNIPQKVGLSGIPKPAAAGSTLAPRPVVQKVQKAPPERPGSSAPPNWAELEAKYKQDIEALTELADMATVDKELAEEKLDSYEREIQELKDKLTEATLQSDNLKREQQLVAAGSNESTVTVLQLQKVEEQNELLKQAVIKLRDMSAKDKQALEELQLEHEELQIKALDLEDREAKYLEQIKVFEEQIDVSQSAHEMVETLTQQKAELEDKLKEMLEDFDDMEKLRDTNEQLLESARETEIELNGEIEKLRVKCSELNNQRRDIEDYLTDQERTVAKLKDENRTLNEQLSSLRDQFREGESIEQQKHQIENVAYKLNFSESKMAEREAELNRYKRNLAEMEEQMNNLSLITKEQSVRLEEMKVQLDNKSIEYSELQRALKKKMEEVSELEIRRDMAEKKIQSIQKDKDSKITALTRQIETMKGIEVQHEEDMKRLMEDNEIIERERRELRDQLNKSNRSLERTVQIGSMSASKVQDTSLASLGISFQSAISAQPSPIQPHQQASSLPQNQPTSAQLASPIASSTVTTAPASARRLFAYESDQDDTIYIRKIKELSAAFDSMTRKNYQLELELATRELNQGMPVYAGPSLAQTYDIGRAKDLRAEADRLKREIRATIINQKICPKSRNIVSQTRNDRFNISRLALKCQALESEANSLMSNSPLVRSLPGTVLVESTPVK